MTGPGGVERALTLDGAAGWRTSVREGLVADRDGSLTLPSLPGRAERFPEAEAVAEVGVSPVDLAGDPGRGLFVLDGACVGIARLAFGTKGARGRVDRLPAIGGVGSGPRRLRGPQSIAVLPSGGIAVADTGNHRVQVFSPAPYALLKVWGATDELGQPTAGAGPLAFRSPWAVAVDARGTLYVADRGNRRIQKISRGGTWLGEIHSAALADPTSLAVGPDGTVAVVDQRPGADVSTGDPRVVWLFHPQRELPRLLAGVDRPESVAFSPGGTLYVSDETGRIHAFVTEAGAVAAYRRAGSGVTGLEGAAVDMLWWDAVPPRLLVLVQDGDGGEGRRLWAVDPSGGRAADGVFVSGPLDSEIERCQWHRVRLDATVPAGSSVEVESFTAEEKSEVDPAKPGLAGWTRCLLAGDDDADCLVQSGPGRYLWLRIRLRSNGQTAPVLRGLTLSYPRTSYLQYLPAAYQEDEDSRRFLERFLAIFQSGFDDLDASVDRVIDLFDPYRVPSPYLRWLAAWVALPVEPTWGEQELRDRIKEAVKAYETRGTVAGLERALRDYARVERPQVLEHFRLRHWIRLSQAARLDGTAPLWSRDFYERLQVTSYSQVGRFRLTSRPEPPVEALDWGAHRFSVFFPADPYHADELRTRVARVVEREKPAHTQADLCPVFPRMRVGVQATIGVDTLVGTVSQLVLNRLATLSYDTILGCSREEQALREAGSAVRPRIALSTSLS